MIRVNANLFRLASTCQSSEETRYYLCGVLVEPRAEGGVLLVTTDGHRLLVIHDETGHADESTIVRLSPEALKACNLSKHGARLLIIDGGNASIHETRGKGADMEVQAAIAVSPNCVVDGTFPDYRRAIGQKFSDKASPAFAGSNLATLATLGAGLALHFHGWRAPKAGTGGILSRHDAIRVLAADDDCAEDRPALVLWQSIPQAFAVLMPVKLIGKETALPEWFQAPITVTADTSAAA